jgi:hypothetical protein
MSDEFVQYTAEIIDVTNFLAAKEEPQRGLHRTKNGVWLVRQTPYDFVHPNNGPHDWTVVRKGEVVRIPLLPYRTTLDTAELIGGAFDLGQRYARQHPEAKRAHLIIGRPVENLQPTHEAIRYWLGYAAQIH